MQHQGQVTPHPRHSEWLMLIRNLFQGPKSIADLAEEKALAQFQLQVTTPHPDCLRLTLATRAEFSFAHSCYCQVGPIKKRGRVYDILSHVWCVV